MKNFFKNLNPKVAIAIIIGVTAIIITLTVTGQLETAVNLFR